MDAARKYAVEHFQRLGYRVLDQDRQTRFGSIPLVAYDGSILVFAGIVPADQHPTSTAPRVRSNLRRRAGAWLNDTPARPIGATLRFDALQVRVDDTGALLSIEHHEGAF
jgi:Holliday junction resolvase-like predicted endonuclease